MDLQDSILNILDKYSDQSQILSDMKSLIDASTTLTRPAFDTIKAHIDSLNSTEAQLKRLSDQVKTLREEIESC